MRLPEFEDLPFYERPDLTPYLVHLTKNTKQEGGYSAFENLVNILQEGKIRASDSSKGFIKGRRRATCFMDVLGFPPRRPPWLPWRPTPTKVCRSPHRSSTCQRLAHSRAWDTGSFATARFFAGAIE
jgi:hypothetical protein